MKRSNVSIGNMIDSIDEGNYNSSLPISLSKDKRPYNTLEVMKSPVLYSITLHIDEAKNVTTRIADTEINDINIIRFLLHFHKNQDYKNLVRDTVQNNKLTISLVILYSISSIILSFLYTVLLKLLKDRDCLSDDSQQTIDNLILQIRNLYEAEINLPEERTEHFFSKVREIITDSFLDFKKRIPQESNQAYLLSDDSKNLNELGIPFHPKEKEVQAMLERAEKLLSEAKKQGKKRFDPEVPYISVRQGGTWKNPLEFLEKVYGKYLSRYNQEGVDYLCQDQLRSIDPRFLGTVQQYILRRNETIADYIPAKSVRITKDIRQLEEIGVNSEKIKIYKEINRIKGSASHRSK